MVRILCCKPLILKKNQKVCPDFATEHILWTKEQQNMVHFSEESKFNLFGSDGKKFVRRKKNGECLSPQRVKNCEIWKGMISSAEVGPIVHFHGKSNASVYKELLCQLALPHLRKGTIEIFMQDNVPCHKAKTVKFS